MEWVISLVAVLVSLVTVVISYLMNRENLHHASINMMTEHEVEFRVSVWNDVITLCDRLVQLTSIEHMEKCVNLVVEGKNNPNGEDETKILGVMQDESEEIRSALFHFHAKALTIDPNATELAGRVQKYTDDVMRIYEDLQEFYLDPRPTQAQYDAIVERVKEFEARNQTFAHTMQQYVIQMQAGIFHSEQEGKHRGNH